MIGMIGIIGAFALLGLISVLLTSLYFNPPYIMERIAEREKEEAKSKQAEQIVKIEQREDGLYIRITEHTPLAMLKQLSETLGYTRGTEKLNAFYDSQLEKWRDELVGKLSSLDAKKLKELPLSQLETLTDDMMGKK
jgi:hypothetical protein